MWHMWPSVKFKEIAVLSLLNVLPQQFPQFDIHLHANMDIFTDI